jgi:hypothetical protein
MTEETYELRLLDRNGSEAGSGTLTMDRGEGGCRLTLATGGLVLEATGPDYFEAFCRVREELERHDLRPHCYGASRNVYPSAMGRDMGSGLTAYRFSLGRAARPEDLVFIFETGDDVVPVTVQEQREYFEAWWVSLSRGH